MYPETRFHGSTTGPRAHMVAPTAASYNEIRAPVRRMSGADPAQTAVAGASLR